MTDTKQFAQDLRQRLEDRGYVQTLSPGELDEMLQDFYNSGWHLNLLNQLSARYNVPYKELRDMLLGRQLIYLLLMTDKGKPGNDQELQAILRNQNANLSELLERLNDRVSRLDEAIRQTELLRDEAARVLACYKAQYLKDQPQEKPQ